MRKCFNGNTVYQLLLFLLLNEGKIEDKQFIFNDNFDKKILEKIKNKKIIKISVKEGLKLIMALHTILFFIKLKIRFIRGEFLEYQKSDIYGESLYSPLLKNKFNKLYLLEDGMGNYILPKDIKVSVYPKIKRKIIDLILFRKSFEYGGRDKRVEKIYLTNKNIVPTDIKNKVEIINLKELWNKKTKEEKEEILSLFDIDIKKIKNLNEINILITQPLSEDRIITEDEKIEIYRKIITKYGENNLVIKPHPREKTDYQKIFPNVYLLEGNIPFELLKLNNLKIKKMITLFSSTVLNVEEETEIDFYGTEVHPKLLERFGSMDHIIKRNCYL